MTCYAQDSLFLPNYLENDGFKKSEDIKNEFPTQSWKSIEKFRWTSIDNWKDVTVVNFTADYVEVKTNNNHENKRIKLYFGLLESPNITTKTGKFWVSSDTNPKNRCNVSLLVSKDVCHFSQVDVMFGNQLDGKGWPSIKFESNTKKIIFDFDRIFDKNRY